jgi:hypothetical protein
MNGTLTQLVSLCSAANGVIANRFEPDTFYPANVEFNFCNSVQFVDIESGFLRKPREIVRFSDANQWLRSLRDTEAVKAWLTFSGTQNSKAPDHHLSALVGGGGDWKLVVTTERTAEAWMSRWKVTAQKAQDNRIWSVTYGCVAKFAQAIQVPQPDLNGTANRLRRALEDTQRFAIKHKLPAWSEWFQRALDGLNLTTPESVQLVCLDSYPETAQSLLAAAYSGWVFGGMGSWNDLGFKSKVEHQQYEELSAGLYAAITDAIQQSTWSFGMSRTQ